MKQKYLVFLLVVVSLNKDSHTRPSEVLSELIPDLENFNGRINEIIDGVSTEIRERVLEEIVLTANHQNDVSVAIYVGDIELSFSRKIVTTLSENLRSEIAFETDLFTHEIGRELKQRIIEEVDFRKMRTLYRELEDQDNDLSRHNKKQA